MVDRDLTGAVQVPADEGDLPEGLLGEDAELEGEVGEEDGGVHVGEVVGGEDGGAGGELVAPRTVTGEKVTRRRVRAQARAMACCWRPEVSQSEVMREASRRGW